MNSNTARWAGIARISGAAALAIAATSLFGSPAQAAEHRPAGAVFVQTDGVSGNAVAVYDRYADGSLRAAGTYPTGGLGGVLTGSVVDHTASQGALLLDGGRLYAVNAGSDTLSVFDVRGDRLVRRQVVSSGGTFPVSVTAHGNLVYVLNARDGGSIQGFLRVGDSLVRIPAWHRALGLDPAAAPEFTHTPGQIAFTPDGSQLIVTTKAGSNAIDVFAVHGLAGPAAHPVVNAVAGTVPFAVAFDAAGHLAVAETGIGAVVTYTLHRDGTVTALDSAATNQAATCWITTDGRHFYASNAGSATVSGFTGHRDGTLTALGNTATDGGTVDATVTPDGRYLYVQTGAAGVVDAFRIGADGGLTALGTVTVPDSVGGEGIAAS